MEKSTTNLASLKITHFFDLFLQGFRFYQLKEFDLIFNEGEGKKLATTLAAYFLRRKMFYDSPLLNRISSPDLQKGLMLIGNYGTGKTSVFETFHSLFRDAYQMNLSIDTVDGSSLLLKDLKLGYAFCSANEVVKEFEGLNSAEEKKNFWDKISTGTKCFDDLTTEHQASNFGKIELFKDILEMRYSNKSKTYITLNYHGNSVAETLDFIAERYGERIYDRLFEMFNIIELKGKSFRK